LILLFPLLEDLPIFGVVFLPFCLFYVPEKVLLELRGKIYVQENFVVVLLVVVSVVDHVLEVAAIDIAEKVLLILIHLHSIVCYPIMALPVNLT
jgi:hypothetical protein